MRNKFRCLLAALLVVVMLIIPANLALGESPPETTDALVTFDQQPGPDEIALIESLGGSVNTIYHIMPTIAATMPTSSLAILENAPAVKIVELDIEILEAFTGEVLPWGVDRVDAELVHPSNKGAGVKVAILDSGIDLDHPDLAVADDVTFVPGTTTGDDDNGHGTLVAGIIGALDNDIGVIGVAPEASLYAVKVLNENGSGVMSVIMSGIEWAVDNDMDVINLGMGGLGDWPNAVVEALDVAYDAGIVIVGGAGNGGNASGEGDNIWAPARYQPVIAVGATDDQDSRYTTSSTGYALELVAPGVSIYSTAMGGDYGYMTGTSASSPHAAGAAALLIASGLTDNADVRYRLRDSAEDLGATGWDTLYGCGMVNADLAIDFTEPPDQSAPITTISLSGTAGNYGWYLSDVEATITATDGGGSGVAGTEYSLDGGENWNTYTSPLSFTTELTNNKILARSWDNAGNAEGPPVVVSFRIDKTAPAVTETAIPEAIQRIGKNQWVSVYYNGTAEDSGSGLVAINTAVIDEYGALDQDFGSSYSGTFDVEAWCDGGDADGRTYTFRFTATDRAGNEASVDAIVTVVKKLE
ncbi:S8 family serine peptidase [Chloroflexota bacterium]